MSEPNTGRRRFLGGLLAAGVVPQLGWADAGSPAYLAAAEKPDGRFVLCGIGADLTIRFELPLPARGHAAAAHPTRPEAVAFARRPGTFAVVLDCATGQRRALLNAPEGRHFYGHGAFSADGRLLFTTENDYELGRGRIGVWDAQAGYRRIDEWESGGVGPHDIKRLPGTDVLVVANGGIDTHPDTGRTKLNIATMAPNLAYIDAGHITEIASLSQQWHKNSIRHLDVSPDGTVAFGMQWQGDHLVEALVGTHRLGQPIAVMSVGKDALRHMDGYVGSIACSADGALVAVTSPRGGVVQIYNVEASKLIRSVAFEDVCGLSVWGDGFVVSAGTGGVQSILSPQESAVQAVGLAWDNHLVQVGRRV